MLSEQGSTGGSSSGAHCLTPNRPSRSPVQGQMTEAAGIPSRIELLYREDLPLGLTSVASPLGARSLFMSDAGPCLSPGPSISRMASPSFSTFSRVSSTTAIDRTRFPSFHASHHLVKETMPESVAGTGSDCSIGKTFDVRSIERMQKGSRRGSSFTIVEEDLNRIHHNSVPSEDCSAFQRIWMRRRSFIY
eukprot:91671_1